MSEDVVTRAPANLITGVVKAMRPRQWVKNVIVLAAPLAALGGPVRYDYVKVLTEASVAFVVFSLAASSVYLINDVRDVEADREHPTKRFRPMAAGVVPLGGVTLNHLPPMPGMTMTLKATPPTIAPTVFAA